MANVRLLPVAISCQSNHCYLINPIRIFDCLIPTVSMKLGCVVRMVVDSILLHAESGPNDHRKDAPPFMDDIISKILKSGLQHLKVF